MYLLRLDDASEYMNIEKWKRMERLLEKYGIKPIFGIIPKNEDPDLTIYNRVGDFWNLAKVWINLGWIPALHGYLHVFETDFGGLNPINNKSEFAGVEFEKQAEKIRLGIKILFDNEIVPEIFLRLLILLIKIQ